MNIAPLLREPDTNLNDEGMRHALELLLQGKQEDRASGAVRGAELIVHFGNFSLIFQKSNIEIYNKLDICPGEGTPHETIRVEDPCV